MANSCRICGTALEPFMSFGEMPIANGFLTPAEFKSEYFFELKPGSKLMVLKIEAGMAKTHLIALIDWLEPSQFGPPISCSDEIPFHG